MSADHDRMILLGREIATIIDHGCSDGHCKIKKKTGMHTNGGCRCYDSLAILGIEMATAAERLNLRRGFPCTGS